MIVLAALNYNEPPFYLVLLGTLGLVFLMVFFGWLRRVVVGMFGGALGAAAIAWYILGKGSGDLVVWVQLVGTPAFGLAGALVCGSAGLVGKWVKR